MTPGFIRWTDYWLGRPVCMALTVLRKCLAAIGLAKPPSQPPKKILIVKLVEQGATVLAYRAIELATQMVGRENVYFLVFERNRAIPDLLGLIPEQNVISVRDQGAWVFIRDVCAALWRARRIGVDAAVDMEFFARASAILTFLSGARRRVGLHRFTSEAPYRGDLFTHRVQHSPYLHVAIAYYMLVRALTSSPSRDPLLKVPVPAIDWSPPLVRLDTEERHAVRELLAKECEGRLPGRLVLLNPNASDLLPLRRWSTDRFIELGKRLLAEDAGLTIAITGAPCEQEAAERIAAAIDPTRAICMAGRTTLRQLLVLYSLAEVLVTNDSGPGHFASLTSIDVVVLFGPETPEVFGPLGSRIRVITAGLGCSPCVSALNHRFSPCHDNVCMQAITVEVVYQAVQETMVRRRKPDPPILKLRPQALASARRRTLPQIGIVS
jgi:ADP-heptose:LPS heptosyltransferase